MSIAAVCILAVVSAFICDSLQSRSADGYQQVLFFTLVFVCIPVAAGCPCRAQVGVSSEPWQLCSRGVQLHEHAAAGRAAG
jgi:hypothetical protein